jgi:pimeloyl-ACP methyl ester carboxylesterase
MPGAEFVAAARGSSAGRRIAAQYTTTAVIDDLEAVRDALGYSRSTCGAAATARASRWNTCAAHPDRVRSVVLDAFAPPASSASRSTSGARATPRSTTTSPRAAQSAAWRKALSRSRRDACTSSAARSKGGKQHHAARSAHWRHARVARRPSSTVIGALQAAHLYAPERASLIPELLRARKRGDFAPLVAASLVTIATSPEPIQSALHYSVTCAEDVPRVDPRRRINGVDDERVRSLARRSASRRVRPMAERQ